MGAWSTRIFDNDISMDILTEYKKLLGYGLEPEDVYRKISDYYAKDFVGQDDEDDYWLAIAYFQWKNGILMENVKKNALRCLEDDSFLERWKESGKKIYEKRKQTVKEFKYNLIHVINPVKKFPKCPAYQRRKTPYKVGDIIVYKINRYLMTENCELNIRVNECSRRLDGKYTALKVIDIIQYPVSHLCPELDYLSCPVVALYDWIGENKPTMQDIENATLMYFIEKAYWIKYDFDTMKKLDIPYLKKVICYGFRAFSEEQLGNKERNELETLGNDGTSQDDYLEFRNKYPELIVSGGLDMPIFYTYADYEDLEY